MTISRIHHHSLNVRRINKYRIMERPEITSPALLPEDAHGHGACSRIVIISVPCKARKRLKIRVPVGERYAIVPRVKERKNKD